MGPDVVWVWTRVSTSGPDVVWVWTRVSTSNAVSTNFKLIIYSTTKDFLVLGRCVHELWQMQLAEYAFILKISPIVC